MTPSITHVIVRSDERGTVTIASTLPPDALDRRMLTPGEVLTQGFLQFAAKNGISTSGNATPLAPGLHAAAVAGPVVAYRISDPNEPDIGHWLSDEPGAAWCKSEPLVAAPTAQTAPAAQGDALTQVMRDVLMEVARATSKFPTWPTDPLHALAVLGEEFGELTKDMLQLTYEPHKTNAENVRNEAMQTAAMALRLFISLGRYEYRASAQHSQGAARVVKEGGAA